MNTDTRSLGSERLRSSFGRGEGGAARRGNTIVLVAGILVLLVIIATSYLTRTQSQRSVSTATLTAQEIDATARIIGESVAEEIGMQLFPWLIDPWIAEEEGLGFAANANTPRLHPSMYELRYGKPAHRYAVDLDFPFNYAPYHTVPHTNWPMPEPLGLDLTMWPRGPGNPANNAGGAGNFVSQGLRAAEHNALGNPGTSDNRLLADIEPVRITLSGSGQLAGAEAFSHWRKMTNLAHANNAWRVLGDISDVEGYVVHNLNIPVEQWLTARPNAVVANVVPQTSRFAAGNSDILVNFADFMNRWRGWFGFPSPVGGYESLYALPGPGAPPVLLASPTVLAPPNFYNLRNLNANAEVHEFGERPQDEFIPDTWRHTVSRVLTDTTGDGFTDAFWFRPPVPVRNGVMTIAAVRVIDNSAMLNMNVAGRFQRNDLTDGSIGVDVRRKTRGHMPTDLAAVGELRGSSQLPGGGGMYIPQAPLSPPFVPPSASYNVGLLDNYANWYRNQKMETTIDGNVTLPIAYWGAHLAQTGMTLNTVAGQNPNPNFWPTQDSRRKFWRLSGRFGLDAPQAHPFDMPGVSAIRPYWPSPYGLADELKLRMFYGNNHPWIFSRLEAALGNPSGGNASNILRAGMGNEETTEYVSPDANSPFGQLTNIRLVRDLRRHITIFSGARNEEMPPWLWWENRRDDAPPPVAAAMSGQPNEEVIERRFGRQSRQKLDLREVRDLYYSSYDSLNPSISPNYFDEADRGRLNFRERLARTILLALTDDDLTFTSSVGYNSYYGSFADQEFTSGDETFLAFDDPDSPLNRTRRLAAGYAANILAYPRHASLEESYFLPEDAVLLPEYRGLPEGRLESDVESDRIGYMPIQQQPFLVEAYIGHVHVADEVQKDFPLNPGGGLFAGDRYFCRDSNRRGTIVIVEIGNPYDTPLSLANFELAVFGQVLELDGAQNNDLGEPASLILAPRQSRVYYAYPTIWDEVGWISVERWRRFLGISTSGDSPMLNPERAVRVSESWSTNRTVYDESVFSSRAIEIRRVYNPDRPGMVVDRIDLRAFGDNEFGSSVTTLSEDVSYTEWLESPLVYDFECEEPETPFWFPPPQIMTEERYHQVQWMHAKRAWELDRIDDQAEPDNKKNPRFVFGFRTIERLGHGGPFRQGNLGDDTFEAWPMPTIGDQGDKLNYEHVFRFGKRDKRYLPRSHRELRHGDLVDQQFGTLDFAMQMLDKRRFVGDTPASADFEQVGELLNVWLFGHQIELNASGEYVRTAKTFAEYMTDGEMTGIYGNFPTVNYLRGGDEQYDLGAEDETNGSGDPPTAVPVEGEARRWQVYGEPHRVNRLRLVPWRFQFENGAQANQFKLGAVVGEVNAAHYASDVAYLQDLRQAVPALPAGVRLMDAFVCDGPGRDGGAFAELELRRFYNANGFIGKITPGLININTAPREVLATLPHMFRIVHETYGMAGQPQLMENPWSRIPQAMIRYRERLGDPTIDPAVATSGVGPPPSNAGEAYLRGFNHNAGPAYGHRGRDRDWFRPAGSPPSFDGHRAYIRGMRGERGMASIGEPLLLHQSGRVSQQMDNTAKAPMYNSAGAVGQIFNTIDFNSSWRIDYATMPDRRRYKEEVPTTEPNVYLFQQNNQPRSARISTDVVEVYDPIFGTPTTGYPANFHPDRVAEDTQEANLLYAGISNLITTRSDVFTVYIRVRSFRQNTVTGKWDATDPDYIIDDSRYVMLVDRSNVNSPSDRPKILYLEKLPK